MNMNKHFIAVIISVFSLQGANGQNGGTGKFLVDYQKGDKTEHTSTKGISFSSDEGAKRYIWQPTEGVNPSESTMGDVFDIKNVKSIIRYVDSDNQFSVNIPNNAPFTQDEIVVKAYGEEIVPDEYHHYTTGAGAVSVMNKDGKIIYDCYASLDTLDAKRNIELNALETAYTLLLPMFPFIYEPTSDKILSTMKSLLAELPETHALAEAIDKSVVKNGYFEIEDVDKEYKTAVETIINKLGLRENHLKPSKSQTRMNSPKKPGLLGGKDAFGFKLVMNSSEWNEKSKCWKCNFTAYNSNRFAYTSWVRGFKANDGRAYYYEDKPAFLMVNILKPQRVSTFMDNFTTWEGLKNYFSDTYRLFFEEEFGFSDMTWDDTKKDFDMVFQTDHDVIIVAEPADNDFMLYYNILKIMLSPIIKNVSKSLRDTGGDDSNKEREKDKDKGEYLIDLVVDLVADYDYQFKFKQIMEEGTTWDQKAKDIMELTYPKFKEHFLKYVDDRLKNVAKRDLKTFWGVETIDQFSDALDDIDKNWNKMLKTVETLGDMFLGLISLKEESFYYELQLDFKNPEGNIEPIPGFDI